MQAHSRVGPRKLGYVNIESGAIVGEAHLAANWAKP